MGVESQNSGATASACRLNSRGASKVGTVVAERAKLSHALFPPPLHHLTTQLAQDRDN